jgi:hypothetical protein
MRGASPGRRLVGGDDPTTHVFVDEALQTEPHRLGATRDGSVFDQPILAGRPTSPVKGVETAERRTD